MIAWTPTGPLKSFTAATTAPTSVQAVSLTGEYDQQYCITNTDSTNDVVVGWAQNDTQAKLNAAAGATVVNCAFVLHSSQVVITASQDAYFTGITGSSTAVVKVQSGTGN